MIANKTLSNLNVNCEMFREVTLLFESFTAFAALKRPLSCVISNVDLQLTSRFAHIVALVTLVRLLPSMVSHQVILQATNGCAGINAHGASVRLFSRVGPFVKL